MISPFRVQIRFADIDSMGHVNNAIYLSYFESARMHYLNDLLGMQWDWEENGIILLKNEVEYVKPLRLRDNAEVISKIIEIGNKSFKMRYELNVEDETYCVGVAHLVAYNYLEGKSQSIPTDMRLKLESVIQE